MDVDLLRPGTVPISPDTVLWFEFLLDPSRLENHLKNNKTDPSPLDLIVSFLGVCPEKKDSEEVESTDSHNNADISKKRSLRHLALKILALKVAAYLKWDLSVIESKLPLPMQMTLLQDLLYFVLEGEVDVTTHGSLDLQEAESSPRVFAVALYHRWVLRAIMYNRLATRHTRNLNVAIPGLQDPNSVPLGVIEDVLKCLEGQAANSMAVLDSLMKGCSPFMPVFETFLMLTEDSTKVKQDWSKGIQISTDEFQCQVLYDLGSYSFFREDYVKAREYFTKTADLFKKLGESHTEMKYCTISSSRLDGYCTACGIERPSVSRTLLHQLQSSIRDQFTGLVNVLQADNLKREIPQVHRDILELDIQGAMSSGKFTVARDLLLQVQTLNVVCRVVKGLPSCADYILRLQHGKTKAVEMLINALKPVLSQASSIEQQRIKLFLLSLCEHSPMLERVVMTPELIGLLSPAEKKEIVVYGETAAEVPPLLLNTGWDLPDLGNTRLQVGNLEHQLIMTYQPEEIKELLFKLSSFNAVKEQWRVNNKWELPIPLQSLVIALPRGFIQDFTFILLAKSRELTAMKDFVAAQELLSVVEREVKQNSMVSTGVIYKLCRLLAWEMLLIQITQLMAEWPGTNLNTEPLVNGCKQCLSALPSGDTVIPRVEILEQCAVCLLNLGQWDYLTGLEKRWNYFELAAAIASACHDIVKYKGNKKVCKDAWDIVLAVFGSSLQQKRSGSGTTTVIHRDSPTHCGSPHSQSGLYQFFAQLRDPTALAVAISLLARIHNVLRDESSLELSVEYTVLWPAAISNSNSFSYRAVGEMLSQLLTQALKYHPNNTSWLKLMADLNFVNGHYAVALKFYLEVGILVSDFFSQPLPRSMMDDHVYRRMIKCCSQLQCYTQAAVLCQFLDEVDYTTAFKNLGEVKTNSCSDAMDAYYSCIWDTTILEYLVYLHTKRGEHHRKQEAIKTVGLLELNANNNEEIQREAANIRKSRFMRALARQFVCSDS
ncbi:integrator complex subunit 8 [Anabrus simplex]|uniref:integrator complex subunit 8 n=1 Tax=Anabrus simplex TaxID=316456 RepID=UPI0035A341C1